MTLFVGCKPKWSLLFFFPERVQAKPRQVDDKVGRDDVFSKDLSMLKVVAYLQYSIVVAFIGPYDVLYTLSFMQLLNHTVGFVGQPWKEFDKHKWWLRIFGTLITLTFQ